MRMTTLAKALAILLLFAALLLQFMALAALAIDLATMGRFGAGAAIAYGASQPFSIAALVSAIVLMVCARISLRVKWIYGAYLGAYLASHLIIWTCALAFPGRFAP